MFGFPKIERKAGFQYQNNFLKTVIFQIKFPNRNTVVKNKSIIIQQLSTYFPINQNINEINIDFKIKPEDKTPIIKPYSKTDNGIQFTTINKEKILSITEDTLTFTVLGKFYSNFSAFLEEIRALESIYKICEISSVDRIAVRKINIVDIELEHNDKKRECAVDVLPLLINENLINYSILIPGKEFISKGITTINMLNGEDKLNFQYGLLPTKNDTVFNIIVDIDLFSTLKNSPIDAIVPKLEEINQEIYNIFMWTFTDKAKELINQK